MTLTLATRYNLLSSGKKSQQPSSMADYLHLLQPVKMSDSEDEEVTDSTDSTDSMVKDTPVKTRGTVKKVIVYTFIYVVGLAVIPLFSSITVNVFLVLLNKLSSAGVLSSAAVLSTPAFTSNGGVHAVGAQPLQQFIRWTNTHLPTANSYLVCSLVSAVIVTLLYIFILRATFRQTGQGDEDTTQVNSSTMTSFSDQEQDLSTSKDDKLSRPHDSLEALSQEEWESNVFLSGPLFSLQIPPSEKMREFSTFRHDKSSRHARIQVPPSEKEWGLSTYKDDKLSRPHASFQVLSKEERDSKIFILPRHPSLQIPPSVRKREFSKRPSLNDVKSSRHASTQVLPSEKKRELSTSKDVKSSRPDASFQDLCEKERQISISNDVKSSRHASMQVLPNEKEREFSTSKDDKLSRHASIQVSPSEKEGLFSPHIHRRQTEKSKMPSFSEKELEWEIDQNKTENEKQEQACPSSIVRHPARDQSFAKEPQDFVCKPCNAPSDDLDEQANAEVTDSFLATHSDCSSCSTESSSTESEKEHDQVEQVYPLPVFSDTWEQSATFDSNGGYLPIPGSKSNLRVPQGSISSREEVNISKAVCADFDKMLKLLEIRDDVHLASPLVEYWAGRDFSFVKDVTISLPHFIPPGVDAADVHVFCITSSRDGMKHESADAEDGDKTKPLVASKQYYLHVQEIHHFGVFYDTLNIFTKHFCGFLCVYCEKETDKKPPRPKLYAMGGGQISTVNGQQHVDLALHIWDERIKNANFRQNDCIRSLPTHTIERIELLEDFQDTQICVNLKLNDEEQNALVHRMVHEGQPSLPCQEIFDFPRFLACKKCVKKGKLEPKTFKWAFKSRPGVPRLQSLEIVVEIVHSKNQPDKHIMTPLLLRVQYQQQSSQYEMRGKKTGFFARLLHPTSRNTPDSGASHSIPASPCQQGNETTSQADHALTLPPPLQSLQRRDALAARLGPRIPATQARETSAARSPRPRSQDLPQDASSAFSSLEGAVGGCDVMSREMTESMEQVTLTAELQQIVDQHVRQRLQSEKRSFQMEKQALEKKNKELESNTKVLEWKLQSMSLNTQMRPPGSNTSQTNRPAEPLEDSSQSDDVELCNPSVTTSSDADVTTSSDADVTTSSDADVSDTDSFQSCDDEQLVPPECMLDNLK